MQVPQILISPLNWGLGHASRCIPIIRYLLDKGADITVATSGRSLMLLRHEFPEIQFIELHGFSPDYPANGKMWFKMFTLIPSFFYHLISENIKISRLIKLQKFDLIISDNRYGVFNKNVHSIIIIHQIRIKVPGKFTWIESILLNINRMLLYPFHEIWIPDHEGVKNYAGDLCHHLTLPAKAGYIGPLSRFSNRVVPAESENKKKHILILLSGQEPQRTILEQILIRQAQNVSEEFILVRGITESSGEFQAAENITVNAFALSHETETLINQSKLIICRPGYSTIMDLAVLGARALLIPTPGQTEQEYLADHFTRSGIAFSVNQSDLDLEKNITAALQYPGFNSINGSCSYKDAIENSLSMV